MTYKRFSIRIPIDAADLLIAEAVADGRSVNQMLARILKERYKDHSHAPPITTKPRKRPAQAKATNGNSHSRKTVSTK